MIHFFERITLPLLCCILGFLLFKYMYLLQRLNFDYFKSKKSIYIYQHYHMGV